MVRYRIRKEIKQGLKETFGPLMKPLEGTGWDAFIEEMVELELANAKDYGD